MTKDNTRLWVRFSEDKYQQFENWAEQLGIPTSQLVALCAWAGAKQVIPALDPDVYEQSLVGLGKEKSTAFPEDLQDTQDGGREVQEKILDANEQLTRLGDNLQGDLPKPLLLRSEPRVSFELKGESPDRLMLSRKPRQSRNSLLLGNQEKGEE